MHELPILINITLSVIAAFVGGYLARLLKLPTMVGYLIAGVAIGPFTPGFIGDVSTIQQLADLGVIFLLFGVGLHFSLRDLWEVRFIAIPGAIFQLVLVTALGTLVAHLWGWSLAGGVLFGVSIAIASTVVMTRNLMDQGMLNTSAGQIAIGWLVLEDLITVLLMVLLPAFTTNISEATVLDAGISLLKAGVFAALMLVAGARVVPWFLARMAFLRSRELFIVAIVVITVGIALAALGVFGVSLALGAFLAGMVISESSLSHQVEAEILPFRETFGVLFFVSVGMLVNPSYLFTHASELFVLVALIIGGKFLLTLLLGFIFPQPARTMLVVAAGRSQIGEFSFILGQAGVALGLLNQDQYSLILAGAIVSITLNPFVFRAIPHIESGLKALPWLWNALNKQKDMPKQPVPASIRNHVIVVGYGRVGRHIVEVLTRLEIPCLVIELDVGRIAELDRQGIPTLYGDAADSEILTHAQVAHARAVAITLPDETAAQIVVAIVRQLSMLVPIIVRAATREGVVRLFDLGANEVIHPELEGGLNIVWQTLSRLGYSENDMHEYLNAVRRDHYDLSASTAAEAAVLSQMRETAVHRLRLAWFPVPSQSTLIGQTLQALDLPARTGATVVAVERAQQVITQLAPTFTLQASDILGMLGNTIQMHAVGQFLSQKRDQEPPHHFDSQLLPGERDVL